MNKKKISVIGLLLPVILVLAACSPKEEMSQEAAEEAMSAEIDVEALIAEKVAGNHDLERIFNADKTREEWNKTLDRMIGYGAEISEEEKGIIIGYLLNK